jgi:spermidine/putrescine transport system permease protein
VWLLVLFVIPMIAMASLSLQEGNSLEGFQQTFRFANFSDAISQNGEFLIRSFRNAAIVTGIALLLAYPVAYWIAFYAGRFKNVFLFLLLLPFFISFVIRTLAWSFILSDNGIIFGSLKSIGLLPENYRVLGTTVAVVAGITYNLLPFTILPLYVSLEQIDHRLVEAAKDLYASKTKAFLKVVLPLSMPGVFAAVLLTSIPAIGDYINASVLGGPGTAMIGNVIQSEFLRDRNYPEATALALVLMAIMLVGAIVYARVLGTERITARGSGGRASSCPPTCTRSFSICRSPSSSSSCSASIRPGEGSVPLRASRPHGSVSRRSGTGACSISPTSPPPCVTRSRSVCWLRSLRPPWGRCSGSHSRDTGSEVEAGRTS